MKGIDIGQVTIHTTPNGDFEYESIDGGHRKRAILGFLNDEFVNPLNEKKFSKHTAVERASFRDIQLTFCTYQNLTGPQVGEIFRTLNSITPVNHQEKLNSYGDIPIANAVREIVRVIVSVGNTPHRLFEYLQSSRSTKKTYSYIKFDNAGLKQDEWVARLFYRYYVDGKNGQAKHEQLQEMYDANPSETVVNDLTKKVTNMLDFILSMAHERYQIYQKTMDIGEANLFARLYLHMENTFGKYSINNRKEFFQTVIAAHLQLGDKNTTDPELLAQSRFDAAKLVWSQYKTSLTDYKSELDALNYPIDLLLSRVDLSNLITVKDKKRNFTQAEKELQLAKQNFKSTITGLPLKLKDAHAGHKVAHAKGGKTVPENLEMVEAEHNTAMGQMSPEDYAKSIAEKS